MNGGVPLLALQGTYVKESGAQKLDFFPVVEMEMFQYCNLARCICKMWIAASVPAGVELSGERDPARSTWNSDTTTARTAGTLKNKKTFTETSG